VRVFSFALALTMAAFAHAEVTLTNTVEKEIEITIDGRKEKQRVPVRSAVPGEQVMYITKITNRGDKSATNIAVVNPLPQHTAYVAGSAYGANTDIAYSIDGGQTYAAADKLIVKNDGEERLAMPSEYTHIRWAWKGELAAGKSGEVGFKAQIR
jgi:uncharacterized repeat protein (TIGR01451 family)